MQDLHPINIVCAKCDEIICQTGLSFLDEMRITNQHVAVNGCWGED